MVATMIEGEIRYVRVPVFVSDHSPLTDTVEIAFPVEGVGPVEDDFHAAGWTPSQTWHTGDSVEARILVGGSLTLAAGVYDVWVRITDGDEQPWLAAGLLVVQSASASDDVVAAAAITMDISVVEGATYSQYFPWREGGVPQSLAGFSAKFAVSKRRGSGVAPLLEVTSAESKIILEPLDDNDEAQVGIVWVRLDPDDTDLLNLRSAGAYDLWLIDNGDPTEVIKLYKGAVTVDRQASDAE
jgi:hypothetical protein